MAQTKKGDTPEAADDQGHIHCIAPKELLRRMRIYAAESGMTIKEIVNSAVEEYLAKHARK